MCGTREEGMSGMANNTSKYYEGRVFCMESVLSKDGLTFCVVCHSTLFKLLGKRNLRERGGGFVRLMLIVHSFVSEILSLQPMKIK